MDDRMRSIQRVLDCSGTLFRSLHPGQNQVLLTLELTMPQLKTLACVAHERDTGATSGQAARSLGVGLSTMTGIVDRLAEQGLVIRREDPEDRRITRVLPTPRGQALVDQLLRWRNEQLTTLLSRLDPDQLRIVEQAFDYLVAAAQATEQRTSDKEAAA
jgi:DNA-binding MarR family transcriptional regulator